MRQIHIEMIGGLAGDMFIAASLDAGLITVEALEALFAKLGLGPIKVRAERVTRAGLGATHVSFEGWDPTHEQQERHWSQIDAMLAESLLDPPTKARSRELFRLLAQAESEIHQMSMEDVHFHEIGAIDSILDFVGAAHIIELAQASWSASLIPQGQGMIRTAHGLVPALAPASALLLRGYPLMPRQVRGELVTPTGATILRAVSPAWSTPAGSLVTSGFGAGTKSFDDLANVVRLLVYDLATNDLASGLLTDQITRYTCEIDDQTPEQLAHITSLLLEAGALDVILLPATMKKGRLGHQLQVLSPSHLKDPIGLLILEQTSTFGVRVETVSRLKLERTFVQVETPWGHVRAKLGWLDGRAIKGSPEYEDCAALSRSAQVPLRSIMEAAQAAITQIMNIAKKEEVSP
jgi:uncharacterized protein (TIGR00299 family) protein